MKSTMVFCLLLVLVATAALCGCASASHRNAPAQHTFNSDPVLNDRSRWVDPVR